MANTNLEQGLFLPIRFYSDIEQKESNKPLSSGVSNNYSYVYVDCKKLIPFQLYIPRPFVITAYRIWIVCVETGVEEELLEIAYKCFGTFELEVGLDRGILGYNGNATGMELSEGLHYLHIEVEANYSETLQYYSDDFMVKSCELPEETHYRVHSKDGQSYRLIDATNLRITNT